MSSIPFEAPSLEVLAELLPAYEFQSFIAQGGMGAVYKARQKALDRDVAIKILPRELGDDPDFRKSFETEAKAMARLNHPNLIGVYDSGDLDGMLYIVMEYVNGKSLYHSAYNLAVDPEQAAALVKGICDGLAHAHENGVIHRDIKPANILLTQKTEPKIGDFGLARPTGADGPGLTMGTPGYTAPEIYRNPDHADRKTDIFAVGVILYELLTGYRPEDDRELPAPSTVVNCDKKLDVIWRKATHPDPAQRYDSAEAMAKDLEGWANRMPEMSALKIVARPNIPKVVMPTAVPHVAAVAPRMQVVRSAGPAAPRPVHSPRAMYVRPKADYTVVWIIVVIVLAGGALFGWQMKRKSDADREYKAKEEAAKIEKAKLEELKRQHEAELNKKPDPSTIRFAPDKPPTPGTPPPAPPPKEEPPQTPPK